MYVNIKLPGDTTWTRVSPSMARDDLEASIREEQRANGKRLVSKLVPGPRERLGRPMIGAKGAASANNDRRRFGAVGQLVPGSVAEAPQPEGRRPRWTGPQGGLPQA